MEHSFLSFFQSEHSFDWIYHFVIMVVVSIIPFAPIPVIAAYIASNHTFEMGLIINMTGTITGSVVLFLLSKNVLRKIAFNYLANKRNLTKYLRLIEHNSFLAILLGRLLPILPSAGINLIAGISNVKLSTFCLATFLGKLPTILAFSLAGHQISSGNWDNVLIIALYLIALFLLGNKLKKRKWSS